MNDPLLDTDIFIHALTHDLHSAVCQSLLRALSSGTCRAILDPLVVHELTYVLPRYVKNMTRDDVAQYLTSVISWDGVIADKETLIESLRLWSTQPVAFIDAYLAARAGGEDRPVYTRNVVDLESGGAIVPESWPT